MSILKDASKNIIKLPRNAKRTIVIIIDISLCIFCTWLAFYLRLEQFIKINDINILAVLISIIIAIPIFWFNGLYRTIFRFGDSSIIFTVAIAIFVYGLIYFSVIGIFGIQGIPRSIGIIQPLLLFFGITSSRITIRYLFNNNLSFKKLKKKNILIYGAGVAGRQLMSSLENNPEMKSVGFLDDNKQFHNQTVLGQTVFDPTKISELINLKDIDLVLLALPSISRNKRNQIIDELNNHKITVKTLPSIQDIFEGKISVSDIKDLSVEDLLSREQVQPSLELLSKNIKSKVVLVTGAGGSIGSELCRQIIRLKPKSLILLELNEFALYNIYEELKSLSQNLKIVPLLVNIQNSSRLKKVFNTFQVDTVYHAAAYKHVSLVEENICESIINNVLGTFQIAQIAIQYKVSNFVLISSDKAVRSTNIMGASKRLAEICTQALYHKSKKYTKFAIVRFGNVLQSSGSVIPKFKKQIKQGGPVTLTHPEVTRYFMTIIEASQLVIQAGAMSEGCEVFILDMGKSVKIKDLIFKMINLSGLTVRDSKNLEGDIEIQLIGLRPGEKLFEELLLGDNPQKTYHEKIQKAQDPFIPYDQLKISLDNLTALIQDNKTVEVKNMLHRLIPSYQSNSKIVDLYYEEQLKNKNDLKTYPKIMSQKDKEVMIKDK
jgi:FlaA1/EpsC-like NDP-sugar epimerase